MMDFGIINWKIIIAEFNFGNGIFGSTQLTGTTYQDSNGRGIFKYQPPTNFSICVQKI